MDFKTIQHVSRQLWYIKSTLKRLESAEKKLLDMLKRACNNNAFSWRGYNFMSYERAGGVDYAKIVKDLNVDVTPYQKPKITCWKFEYSPSRTYHETKES